MIAWALILAAALAVVRLWAAANRLLDQLRNTP